MTRARLAAVAALIGAATIGGVQVRAWQLDSEVPLAVLVDGGILNCPSRFVTCPFRVGQHATNFLADAGLTVAPGYHTLSARVRVCTQDNGSRDIIFPPLPSRFGELPPFALPDPESCTIAADPGGALWRVSNAASPCVRAPADGGQLCRRRQPPVAGGDGGWYYFGADNAFRRAESNGHASCVPSVCVVYAGESP